MTGFFEGTGEGLDPIAHTIGFHEDVTIDFGSLIDGQALRWNSADSQWKNITVDPSTFFLGDLGDVNSPSGAETDGYVLTWSGAQNMWIPAASSGGTGFENLYQLLDTDIVTPSEGQVLVFESGLWTNSTTPNLIVETLQATTSVSSPVVILPHATDVPTFGQYTLTFGAIPLLGGYNGIVLTPSTTEPKQAFYIETTNTAGDVQPFTFIEGALIVPAQTGAGAVNPSANTAISKAFADENYGATASGPGVSVAAGHITSDGSGAQAITNSFGISSVSIFSGDRFRVTLSSAASGSEALAITTGFYGGLAQGMITVDTISSTQFDIILNVWNGSTFITSVAANLEFHFDVKDTGI